jgi:hypothetical protein
VSTFVISFYYSSGTLIILGSSSAKVRNQITVPVPLRQKSYGSCSETLVFLSKPTATGAPSGRLSVRMELMAAQRLEAEGGGGGHAVTRRSHGDVQGSVRRAALFLIPIK